MQKTNIGWTDFSANLLKYRDPDGNVVHACVHASEGCRNCYAEVLAPRWGRKGKPFTAENMKNLTPFFDAVEAKKLLTSIKTKGKKVFIDDMTDLFGEWVPDEIIDQHFATLALRPDITFQVLTKRAKRMREYVNRLAKSVVPLETAARALGYTFQYNGIPLLPWPIRNIHLGVSVEDQKQADTRIGELVQTPAAVRWASIEPLLSDVSLRWAAWEPFKRTGVTNQYDGMRRLNGIVIGGESGAGHREMPLESAINLARQAKEAGVAVYFKQDSGPRPGMQGRVPSDVWAMKEWPSSTQQSSGLQLSR